MNQKNNRPARRPRPDASRPQNRRTASRPAHAPRREEEAEPFRCQEIQPETEAGRNPNPCPVYKKCGGCQLQNLDYPHQLQWKQRLSQRLLGKFAPVQPILGMKDPRHYRNKVQAAFAMTRSHQIISGVYQSSTHKIVSIDRCMTEDPTADRIIVDIRRMLPEFRILPYQEESGQGWLRHVLVKRGFASGQIMVVLVGSTPIFPMKKKFTAELIRRHPEITTVLMNVNPMFTSMILGDRPEQVLYGPGYIEDTLCGCTFRISAKSFYQINPLQTEVLYGKAIELAELTGSEEVIDAYCGIGTIGLIVSKHVKSVLGVEVNKAAVQDAIANAKRNGIKNAYFQQGDAGQYMRRMAAEGRTADVVFMDPPRAGSDRAFLSSLAEMAPAKVVYISCNPETQARDLEFLTHNGYRCKVIQPVDMFPHTNHVETIALLTRSK